MRTLHERIERHGGGKKWRRLQREGGSVPELTQYFDEDDRPE
jgi:hypothetical protein